MLNKRFSGSEKASFWARHKVKIASLIFAIIVWFLIVADAVYTHVVDIPVRYPDNPDFVIENTPANKIRIRLQGNGFDILSTMLFNEAFWEPDIKWEKGEHSLQTNDKNIILQGNSKNLRIIQILEPDTVHLQIDALITRTLPVSPRFTLKPAPGFTLVGMVSLLPDSIKVTGPEGVVDTMKQVFTIEKSFQGLKAFTTKVIELAPASNRLVSYSEDHVRVEADIQKIMEKRISNVPVRVENVPSDMRPIVLPARIELLVLGGVSLITPLTADSFEVYLDYRSPIPDGEHTYRPVIKPIEGVRIGSHSPERFKIVLEKD